MRDEREQREAEQEVVEDKPVLHGGEGDPLGEGVNETQPEEKEGNSP